METVYALCFIVKEQIYEQRQQYTAKSHPTAPPTKIIVERHYAGTEKMETEKGIIFYLHFNRDYPKVCVNLQTDVR